MTPISTIVLVHLRLAGGWGVGGVASIADEVDLPVQTDPITGRPHLPGSSVAGSLRAHLGDRAATWLGPGSADLAAVLAAGDDPTSRLWVHGCVLGEDHGTARRGQTAVAPRRAAAAAGQLRLREEVAGCGELPVVVVASHDGPVDDGLLTALAEWPVRLGRGATTGSGQARVERVEAFAVDRRQPEQLTWWLGTRPRLASDPRPPDWAQTVSRTGTVGDQGIVLDIEWQVAEPLRVGVAEAPSPAGERQPRDREAHIQPLYRVGDQPAVPGSSWKGVFRSQAQLILRAAGADQQLVCAVLDRWFGSPAARGALTFSTSLVGDPQVAARSHVAIDRIGGGAAAGLLFRQEVVVHGRLDLRVTAEGTVPSSVELLLWHVVRDIHDGLVGIGGGTTRGYGWLQLADTGPVEALEHLDQRWLERLRADLMATSR